MCRVQKVNGRQHTARRVMPTGKGFKADDLARPAFNLRLEKRFELLGVQTMTNLRAEFFFLLALGAQKGREKPVCAAPRVFCMI